MGEELQVVSDLLTEFVDDKVKGLIEKKEWMEECSFNLVRTREEFTDLVDKLIGLGLCALDLETTGLNTRVGRDGKPATKIVGVCLAESKYVGYYVPVSHEDREYNLPYDFVVRELGRLVKNCRCIYHFFKFDGQVLHNHGIDVADESMYEDTHLMAGVDDASSRDRGLKKLSESKLGREMIGIAKLGVTSGKKKLIRFDLVPPQIAVYYGCSDAMNTFGLYEHFTLSLDEQDPDRKGGPWAVYEKIEKRCQFAVMEMERNLCRLDIEYLQKKREELVGRMRTCTSAIYEAAGREVDINSPKQLGVMLFEEMGIKYPEREKTASGQYKTDEGTLMKIADTPVVKMILEYRGLEKIVGTYVDNFLNNVDEDGFVKFQLNQLRADTGRFSASGGKGLHEDGYSGVNCQNIPKPDEDDPNALDLRGAIVAREGYKILTIDYSGEELRIAANFSREPKWLDVFQRGSGDLHLMTAKVIYNDPSMTAEKNKKERSKGKTLNFLTLFGGGASRFAAQAKIPFETARKMIINFFRGYPALKKWIDAEIKRSRKRGYSKTAFGRRRPLKEFYAATDKKVQAKGDRCAVNSAVQGSGADIIKIALYRCWKWIRDNGYGDDVRMLMPIHDEIVFEVREDKMDFFVPELCEIMKMRDLVEALGWVVPLEVDAEYGDSFHVDRDYWKERGGAPAEPAPAPAASPAPRQDEQGSEACKGGAEGGVPAEPDIQMPEPVPETEPRRAPRETSAADREPTETMSDGQFHHFTVTVREAVLAASEKARDRLEAASSTEPDEALRDIKIKDRMDHRGVFLYPIEDMDIITVHQLEAALKMLAISEGMFIGPRCRVSLVNRKSGEVWYESSRKVSLDAFLALCLWLKI